MSGRTLVLSLLMVGLTVVLSIRLFEIQVTEGEVWAGEAARLVRSGRVLRYQRGDIKDSEGRTLVRDTATYRLELSYREFRRKHVLGLLAHSRSALEVRAVSLVETFDAMDLWALELGELSPSELDEFGRGGPLRTPTLDIPPVLAEEEDYRSRRASDVRYYVANLFDLTKLERNRLKRLQQERIVLPSYFELIASWRGQTAKELRRSILDRVERSRDHLGLLAELLDQYKNDEELQLVDPLYRIVEDLETVRSTVEELVTAGLFREAAGFSPGRLNEELLYNGVDLSWLGRALYWNDDRLREWTHQTRRRWLSWRKDYAVPRLLAEFVSESTGGERTPERLLSLLGTVYSNPEILESVLDQRSPEFGAESFAVLSRLSQVFGVEPFEDLPDFQLSGTDAFPGEPTANPRRGWRVLEGLVDEIDVTDDNGQPDDHKAWRVRQLRKALRSPSRLSSSNLRLVAEKIVPLWELEYQDALAERIERAKDVFEREGRLAPNGRLLISEERRQLALESFRDVLRDYGDRTLALDPHPPYEAVYLLTRFPKEYEGFRAVDSRVRNPEGSQVVSEATRRGVPLCELASEVIGSVSAVGIDESQRQRKRENRLRALRSRTRSALEDEELKQLVGEVLLHDESRGVSGVEGEWDEELRGKNGYREARGLEDKFGRGRSSSTLGERQDGQDLVLTVDAELQYAAEWMLENPVFDPTDRLVDEVWFAEPVGAIVMLSAAGEVVVSASVPNGITDAMGSVENQRADRAVRMDRTLRKPRFLPPGSVFKPFVALWALEHLGLDPYETVPCRRENGPAEYLGVRCWNTHGHGDMDLSDALKHSCNCYFAWLGAEYPSILDFQNMAIAFGYGQPTGLKRPDSEGFLREDYVPKLFGRRLSGREPSLAGNGLSVVEATPMQVARATLALATGKLFPLTNVRSVGGVPIPRPLPVAADISPETFRTVRDAIYRVANEEGGTAYKALRQELVGVEVCVKTGSADLSARQEDGDDGKSPKHTWVAGWLPPEKPVAVFVIFLDRTYATSSHTAVYVARQFLSLPETRAWLEKRGVETQDPETGR